MIQTRISIRTKKRNLMLLTGEDVDQPAPVEYVHLTSADLSVVPEVEWVYEEEEASTRKTFGFTPVNSTDLAG